jgi:uncharacterized protein (DUF433 family)
MATATLYPHIEVPQDGSARLMRVPRIRVSQLVADYLAYGWSPEEMCRQHPYLMLSEAYTVMAYYFENSEAIDRELGDEVEQSKRERASAGPSELASRLRAQGRL